MTGVVVAPPEDGYVTGLQSETLLFKGTYSLDPTNKKYKDVTLNPDASNPDLGSNYIITGVIGWDTDASGVFIYDLPEPDPAGFVVSIRTTFESTKLTNKELKVWVRAIRILK